MTFLHYRLRKIFRYMMKLTIVLLFLYTIKNNYSSTVHNVEIDKDIVEYIDKNNIDFRSIKFINEYPNITDLLKNTVKSKNDEDKIIKIIINSLAAHNSIGTRQITGEELNNIASRLLGIKKSIQYENSNETVIYYKDENRS